MAPLRDVMKPKIKKSTIWHKRRKLEAREKKQAERIALEEQRKADAKKDEEEQQKYFRLLSQDILFKDRVENISKIKLNDLKDFIKEAGLPENVPLQEHVLTLCLARILKEMDPDQDRQPHKDQVITLHRLIFIKGDCLLIAPTGWGKSLILHAFAILTGKISFQITPLNKLGEDQLAEIKRMSGTNPCLLNSQTKKRRKHLVDRIKAGEFSHVILGPEQASSNAFRNILKDPQFLSKIGMVAIDECHLIEQWQNFRQKFTMIGELRQILNRDTVWFGCSATLDDVAEDIVLKKAGFRSIGLNSYQTEVMRNSIDRPDISISVNPIPKGESTKWRQLYFLIMKAIYREEQKGSDDETVYVWKINPQLIPKTIVFVDSMNGVDKCADTLRDWLIQLSNWEHDEKIDGKPGEGQARDRYCKGGPNSAFDVFNIIETFTSHVSKYDQDNRYEQFRKEGSEIRIMVATTSLGTGINIPDVEVVVIWKFPLEKKPAEAWQRAGRGGRGKNRKSRVYFFFPYWAFDSEGKDPFDAQPLPEPKDDSKKPKATRSKNKLPKQKGQSKVHNKTGSKPSKLRESIPAPVIESQETANHPIVKQGETSNESSLNLQDKRKNWTLQERIWRRDLPGVWHDICNGKDGKCKRTPILLFLKEGRLPQALKRVPAPPEECCNGIGCNPILLPEQVEPPEEIPVRGKPSGNSKAGFGLEFLEVWATNQAEARYSNPYRRFPMPPDAYMPEEIRWALSYLYADPQTDKPGKINTGGLTTLEWITLNLDILKQKVPEILGWDLLQNEQDNMLVEIKRIHAVHTLEWLKRQEREHDLQKIQEEEARLSEQIEARELLQELEQIEKDLAARRMEVSLEQAKENLRRISNMEPGRVRISTQFLPSPKMPTADYIARTARPGSNPIDEIFPTRAAVAPNSERAIAIASRAEHFNSDTDKWIRSRGKSATPSFTFSPTMHGHLTSSPPLLPQLEANIVPSVQLLPLPQTPIESTPSAGTKRPYKRKQTLASTQNSPSKPKPKKKKCDVPLDTKDVNANVQRPGSPAPKASKLRQRRGKSIRKENH